MEQALKLLVIDDDELDRLALRRALQHSNFRFELQEAETAAVGTALLASQPFDCAFLDYRLPDSDGLTLVLKLRDSGLDIPLIALTGQGSEETAVSLLTAGMSDYLSKSKLSSDTLTPAIHRVIRVYRAEQEAALANKHLQHANKLLKRKNQELEVQREEIQRRNLQLIEVSRLKSEFLATMSHELKTPLNVIIGFSQVLMRRLKAGEDNRYHEMVERIFFNGQHLLMLINDILDYSKLEAGRLNLRHESVNLSDVVASVVEALRPLAKRKHIRIEKTVSLSSPILTSDGARLRQVLDNLVSNAVKFTDVGQVWVSVQELPQDTIEIAVKDTGIGIAADDLPHIFDALYQIDQTVSRKHKGTGLGLSITQLLVEMMQGGISVESSPGEGSCFTVTLPRQLQSPSLAEKLP
ncbi:MAG: hybrid sensor histidine kinase/response regulator [Cyanobacteria bacterium P01_A01_bin.135]